MVTDLVNRATVLELVAVYSAAEADVRSAFAMVVAAEQRLNAAYALGDMYAKIHVSACGTNYRDNFADVESTVRIMRRDAWRALVQRMELRRLMSVKRWAELERQFEERSGHVWPAITEENVMSFAREYSDNARDMLTEAVQEVFEWLRPRKGTRAGDLKTNSEMEVPAKVILGYAVSMGWHGRYNVCDHDRQKMIAMENIFNGLDGNGTVCKGYQSLLQTAIEAAPTGEGETDLFRFKACRNRNLHIWFKRPDLLARFNQIAGGKRLRPAA